MSAPDSELQARVAELEAEVRALRAQLASGPRFAALYADFTDRFRGTTEEVTAKLRGYEADVRRLVLLPEPVEGPEPEMRPEPFDKLRRAPVEGPRVLDVGCGRGEWLTLLAELGVRASGVDINPDFVAAGRERGLDVVEGDAIAHLTALEPGSLDLVTTFHIIEHLNVDYLLALFEAARRALRPGGALLVETPNPTNLAMGACNFYLDPTHRSPLPPALTAYLVGATGFVDIEVRPLYPAGPPWPAEASTGSELEQAVVRALYGPRDYAVLGYAPHSLESAPDRRSTR